jgi:hypothetical protein
VTSPTRVLSTPASTTLCPRGTLVSRTPCRRRWWSLGVNVLSEAPTYSLQEPNPTRDISHHSESNPTRPPEI